MLSFSALIPAAGSSNRMGSDKTLLRNIRGATFASHLVTCFLNYGCKPVVIVVNDHYISSPLHLENVITALNLHPEKGRSWSILLGLKQVPVGHGCFVQNIDNPFVDELLLDKLAGSASPGGYAVPVCNGRGGHPLLLGHEAVDLFRHKKNLPDFRRELQCLARVEVPFADDRILWNVNTPADYKEFIRQGGE